MNTKSLAKHYPTLTPAERLALMMAAGARGDEVEHARLADAAPREHWRVPHTFGRALAFLAVFSQHRMERLELVARFFKTAALAEASTGKTAARLRDATGLYGYLVLLHATAWARFCEGEHLDPTVCEGVAPGTDTLERAAREAEIIGFTDAEAREYVRRGGPDAPTELKTVAAVTDELRAAFAYLNTNWA